MLVRVFEVQMENVIFVCIVTGDPCMIDLRLHTKQQVIITSEGVM